jgi:hypothetical protein
MAAIVAENQGVIEILNPPYLKIRFEMERGEVYPKRRQKVSLDFGRVLFRTMNIGTLTPSFGLGTQTCSTVH